MESEYETKIIELQAFLPALEKRIADARNRKDSLITSRLEKLRDIVIKKIKVPMGILLKTEEAIKKFVKDIPSSKADSGSAVRPASSNKSREIISPTSTTIIMTEIKTEPIPTVTNNASAEVNDNDDIQIVPNSETVILLDSDSDEEPEKEPSTNLPQVKSPQVNIKCEQPDAADIPSPISKEILKVKEEDGISCHKSLPISPKPQNIETDTNQSETEQVLMVIDIIPRKDEIVCIDDDDDEDDERNIPGKGSTEKSDSSEPNFLVPSKIKTEVSETEIPSKFEEKSNSIPNILPQVQFDPSKVAESRGILHEVESQLKQLKSVSQLSLSLDTEKENSIDAFLAKSTDLSSTPAQELMEAEIFGNKDSSTIVNKEAETIDPTENKLPFPLLNFGKIPAGLENLSNVFDKIKSSENVDSNRDAFEKPSNESSMSQVPGSLEKSEVSKIVNIETTNLNKRPSFDGSNAETSSTIPSDNTLSNDCPQPEGDNEQISEAELTMKANSRLAGIIASLRKNLNEQEENKKSTEESKKNSVEPSELFVNKIHLTEIPSLVQDMLSVDMETKDQEMDEEDQENLLIDDEARNADISNQLLDDLDTEPINLENKVTDPPLSNSIQIDDDDEDSLDREINQAMAENKGKDPALIDLDSSDVIDLSDEDEFIENKETDKGSTIKSIEVPVEFKTPSKEDLIKPKPNKNEKVKIIPTQSSMDVDFVTDIDEVAEKLTSEVLSSKNPDSNIKTTQVPNTEMSSLIVQTDNQIAVQKDNQNYQSTVVMSTKDNQKDNVDQILATSSSEILDLNETQNNLITSSPTKVEIIDTQTVIDKKNTAKDKTPTREVNSSVTSLLDSTPELVIDTSSDVTFNDKNSTPKAIVAKNIMPKAVAWKVSKETQEIIPNSEICRETKDSEICNESTNSEICKESTALSNIVENATETTDDILIISDKDSSSVELITLSDENESSIKTINISSQVSKDVDIVEEPTVSTARSEIKIDEKIEEKSVTMSKLPKQELINLETVEEKCISPKLINPDQNLAANMRAIEGEILETSKINEVEPGSVKTIVEEKSDGPHLELQTDKISHVISEVVKISEVDLQPVTAVETVENCAKDGGSSEPVLRDIEMSEKDKSIEATPLNLPNLEEGSKVEARTEVTIDPTVMIKPNLNEKEESSLSTKILDKQLIFIDKNEDNQLPEATEKFSASNSNIHEKLIDMTVIASEKSQSGIGSPNIEEKEHTILSPSLESGVISIRNENSSEITTEIANDKIIEDTEISKATAIHFESGTKQRNAHTIEVSKSPDLAFEAEINNEASFIVSTTKSGDEIVSIVGSSACIDEPKMTDKTEHVKSSLNFSSLQSTTKEIPLSKGELIINEPEVNRADNDTHKTSSIKSSDELITKVDSEACISAKKLAEDDRVERTPNISSPQPSSKEFSLPLAKPTIVESEVNTVIDAAPIVSRIKSGDQSLDESDSVKVPVESESVERVTSLPSLQSVPETFSLLTEKKTITEDEEKESMNNEAIKITEHVENIPTTLNIENETKQEPINKATATETENIEHATSILSLGKETLPASTSIENFEISEENMEAIDIAGNIEKNSNNTNLQTVNVKLNLDITDQAVDNEEKPLECPNETSTSTMKPDTSIVSECKSIPTASNSVYVKNKSSDHDPGTPLRDERELSPRSTSSPDLPHETSEKLTTPTNIEAMDVDVCTNDSGSFSQINVDPGTPLRDENKVNCEAESSNISTKMFDESQGTPVRDEPDITDATTSDEQSTKPLIVSANLRSVTTSATAKTVEPSAFSEIGLMNNNSTGILPSFVSELPQPSIMKFRLAQIEEASNSSTNMDGEPKAANLAALMQAEYNDRLMHIMTPLDASQDAKEFQSRTVKASPQGEKPIKDVSSFSKVIDIARNEANSNVEIVGLEKSSPIVESSLVDKEVLSAIQTEKEPQKTELISETDEGKTDLKPAESTKAYGKTESSTDFNIAVEKSSADQSQLPEKKPSEIKKNDRIVAAFNANSELKSSLNRRKELERKLSDLKDETQLSKTIPTKDGPISSDCANLSDISPSDEDCLSLSLSDISDKEEGEITDKPPMPFPKIVSPEVKSEPLIEDPSAPISRRSFPSTVNKLDLVPLKVTIKNEVGSSDLRAKLLAKHGVIDEPNIEPRKKHRKKKRKHKKRNTKDKEVVRSPIRYLNGQGLVKHVSINLDSEVSDSSDLPEFDEQQDEIDLVVQKRIKSERMISAVMPSHSFVKLELEEETKTNECENPWDRVIKIELPADDKYELQRQLRARLAALDEELGSKERQSSKTPTQSQQTKTKKSCTSPTLSKSSSKDRISPFKLMKSPKLSSRSPTRKAKSQRRSSESPKRRSKSPKRRSKSPIRISRSPIRRTKSPISLSSLRRRSRSPRKRSRSPMRIPNASKRRSRSPRRRSTSPRRRSRSPRRSPRRRSITPKRRLISPKRRSRSPRRRSLSPRRRSISPRRRSISPRRRSISPRKRLVSPRRRSKSPRRRSISPRRRSISPRRKRSISPKRRLTRDRSKSPSRRSRSPKRSPLRRLSRSPKKELKLPTTAAIKIEKLPSPCSEQIKETLIESIKLPETLNVAAVTNNLKSKLPTESIILNNDAEPLENYANITETNKETTESGPRTVDHSVLKVLFPTVNNESETAEKETKESDLNNSIDQSVLKVLCPTVIDVSDSDEDEKQTRAPTPPPAVNVKKEQHNDVGFTIEVSDDDEEMIEPPPPPIISKDIKMSPKHEATPQEKVAERDDGEDYHVILVDDDDDDEGEVAVSTKSVEVEKSSTPPTNISSNAEERSARTTDNSPKPAESTDPDISINPHPVSNIISNPKLESISSKAELSEGGCAAELDGNDFDSNDYGDNNFEEPLSPEETLADVEALKEKNLNELNAIRVKLEKDIGISSDVLSQLFGNAVEKYSGVPVADYTPAVDCAPPNMQYNPPPDSFMISTDFYDRVMHPVPHINPKDPRLNRTRPQPSTPVEPVVNIPKFDEVPPPPLIPRLTPAVALPSTNQPSKSLKYNDEYSDEDDISISSGVSTDYDDDERRSGSSKHDKKFVRIDMSKLEEIIGKQIAKYISANQQLAGKKASKTSPPSRGSKSKKDTTLAPPIESPEPPELSPEPINKTKKPRKNALSKDGSGPFHMNAEQIVSDIKKNLADLCKPKSKTPDDGKSRKTKSKSRIKNRYQSSSDSDGDFFDAGASMDSVEGKTPPSKISPKTKSPSVEPSALRNKIHHDLTGIIKLGKTSKSAKVKPTPALKMAEQLDSTLLTPLREMPFDDKRKKKPDAGGTKKQKRAPKNTDMSMHWNSGDKNCLLCKEMEKDEELISHYANYHRENEVYVARLELGQIEALKDNPNLVKPARKSNIEKYSGKCPFCSEEMCCPIGRFMEHFAVHTGEYAYECDGCGWREPRKRDLLKHCNTECKKGARFIYVYRYDLSNKIIPAYVCLQCNYTQLNSANVIKHIRSEHDQQQVKTSDYLTLTFFQVDDTVNPEDKSAEEEIDKIEVNNEAIAEEDDDYDAYDNFDYDPDPESGLSHQPSVSEAIEYVKNEFIMDAIESIDWKPLEDTLAEPLSGEAAPPQASNIQQPTISANDSLHIVPKTEALDQSIDNAKSTDIGSQIFTEVHAMATGTPLQITTTNSASQLKSVKSASKSKAVEKAAVEKAKSRVVEEKKSSADSPSENTTKKVVKFKNIDKSQTNISRVQSIGIEKTGVNRFKFHCFVSDCDFNPVDTLEDFRKHMRSHRLKWNGQCVACGKKGSKKYSSIDREFLHLVNDHLPEKSYASKLLRPWIKNDPSECYKTKDVCEMLLNEFHLENLCKCMGPNCIFTTNSLQDLQFHITLNHSDDITALYCSYCTEHFIHTNGLIDHIGKVHGASKYQCSKCFYRSCAAYNVQMHQRTFHDDEKSLKIIVSGGQTHTFSTEMLEILDHRQRNVKPLSCPYHSACRKLIFVKHLLLDHIVKDHSRRESADINSAIYDCVYCAFGTTDLLSIRQHMANEHPSQLLYVCGLVFIKALHPLASANTIDITSIKTTSLVYIGDIVNKKKFIIKCQSSTNFDENSIEAVNHGHDATALNERIRQMFGEAAITYNDVESYIRKIAEGMQPDTIKTEERSELDQLVSAAIKDTGFVGKELYKCGFPKCQRTFDNFEQFDRHISTHAGDKKEPIYRCPHCNRIIPTNQIRMHTIQHRRHRYLCILCGGSSASQNLAIEHLKLVHQSQSNVFEYLTSDKDWDQKYSEQESRIFVAMQRKHDGDTIEKIVEVLRKRFNPNESAEEAPQERPESPVERKEETIIPVFVSLDSRLCCNIDACPFVAKTDEELMQHISERHLIIMSGRYSCAHCPYGMGSAQMKISRIGNHLRYHGPTILVCNVCNYYHYNRLRVLNHINMCHPYNFVTMTLHARSTNGTKLKLEILYNKKIRSPEDNYKCTLCSAILTECDDFFIHMKENHQLNVRFKCDMCPFFDNNLQAVESHTKKTHADEPTTRIRSVFLPAGGKWVQNLSPFELLIESSEGSEQEPTNIEAVSTAIPPAEESSSKSPKPLTNNSPERQANHSPERQTNNSPPIDKEIKTESSKKRKIEEPEIYRPGPASKKLRKSGIKRANSGSKEAEEGSKRIKISTSPERTAESVLPNKQEVLTNTELIAALESDSPIDLPLPTASHVQPRNDEVPVISQSKSPTRDSVIKELLKAKEPPKVEISNLKEPPKAKETIEISYLKEPPKAKGTPKNEMTTLIKLLQPEEKPTMRLKLVPFEKLMANPPQENIQDQVAFIQPPNNVIVSSAELNYEMSVNLGNIQAQIPHFTAPTSLNIMRATSVPVEPFIGLMPTPTTAAETSTNTNQASTSAANRRIKTEVYISCTLCSTKCEFFIELRKHFRTYHPDDVIHFRVAKKLLCAYCRTYTTFNEMKSHHFNDHSNDLFITRETTNHKKCAECSFESASIQMLKEHVEKEHSNLYVQMHSSYKFLTQSYLEELLKIGVGQVAEIFRCAGCDHIYLQSSFCKNHAKKVHPNTTTVSSVRVAFRRILYGCGQCSVYFETETRAIQHIRKHIDPYGCNHCEMSFPTHSALEDHYRLFHKSTEQSYQFRNVSHNFQKFLEMQLRFPNGLVLSKLELENTDYGQHEEFLQRIEFMEKNELRNWISRQERTQQIDSIARIKIELEQEADMFVRATTDGAPPQ